MATSVIVPVPPLPLQRVSLPPVPQTSRSLVSEGATDNLLRGLRQLDVSVQSPRPALSNRHLRSISELGLRANERVAEADAKFVAHDVHNFHQSSGHFAANNQLPGTGDALLSAGASAAAPPPIRPLKKDEPFLDGLPGRGIRFYKILLPTRPSTVTVSLTKNSGVAPSLWGSTKVNRPTEGSCDLRGKEKLVYVHALKEGGEDGEDHDEERYKRFGVPDCRELFFAVEAEAGECTFKLLLTSSFIRVKLSDEELAEQTRRVKKGWAARLEGLLKEPAERELFEERLKTLKEDRRRRQIALCGGKNFLNLNSRSVAEASIDYRKSKLMNQAIKLSERRERASIRREDLEQETETRRMTWLSKTDSRRKEREAEELRLELEHQVQDVQKKWLEKLALVAATMTLGQRFQELKLELERSQKSVDSAMSLQRCFARYLSHRRSHVLRRNLIHLRVAMATFCRVMQPVARAACQPVVKRAMDVFGFGQDSSSLRTSMTNFRCKVVKLQHFFRRVRMMRGAYFSIMLPIWQHHQEEVYQKLIDKWGSENWEALKVSRALPHPVHLPPQPIRSLAECKEYMAEQVKRVPDWLAKYQLIHLMQKMQRSFPARVKSWREQLEYLVNEASIEAFSGQQEETREKIRAFMEKKPRAVYIDADEIGALVEDTVVRFSKHEFRKLHANRYRILKGHFKAWKQQYFIAYAKEKGINSRPGSQSSQLMQSQPLHRSRLSSPHPHPPRASPS